MIGAGFIGLEVAATAAKLGAETAVVEIARPMGRAVSPVVSDSHAEAHRAFGERLFLGDRRPGDPRDGEGRGGRACRRRGSQGRPRARRRRRHGRGPGLRARPASPATTGSSSMRSFATSDPAISAIGDCAHFPHAGLGFTTRTRIDRRTQSTRRNAWRPGSPASPRPTMSLPWFWSDQGDLKLMIAGLSHGVDQWVVRGDPEARAFSAFGFRNGKLAAVELVNRAGDHAAAKRILGSGKTLTPEQAADPAFDIRALAKG